MRDEQLLGPVHCREFVNLDCVKLVEEQALAYPEIRSQLLPLTPIVAPLLAKFLLVLLQLHQLTA